ncbi:uncharacterized protein LOC144745371 [Ciona intestinalis]
MERITAYIKERYNTWQVSHPPKHMYSHEFYWAGFTRINVHDFTSFKFSDGVRMLMPKEWYYKHNLAHKMPTQAEFDALPQLWLYPVDPNNDVWQYNDHYYGFPELCGTYHAGGGWVDWGCFRLGHTFCEKGPYPFERWHFGGTEGLAQPDNTWCVERCGTMNTDYTDEGRDEFTSITYEYWKDHSCTKMLTFSCEVDNLPAGCETYMPPLTPACVKEIFKNSSCTRELSQAAIELFAKKTTGKLLSWLKEKVHRAQVDPDSIESQLFLQLCHQPRFIHSFSPEIPNLLLEPKGKTYEEAVEYCTSMNATLPTLKTQYQVDIIMSRALGSSNVTGYTKWWIGLDDVYAEGNMCMN